MSFRWPTVSVQVPPVHLQRALRNITKAGTGFRPPTDDIKRLRALLEQGQKASSTYTRKELRILGLLVADAEVGDDALAVLLEERQRLGDRSLALVLAYRPSNHAVRRECQQRLTSRGLYGPKWFKTLHRNDLQFERTLASSILQRLGHTSPEVATLLNHNAPPADSALGVGVMNQWILAQPPARLLRAAESNIAMIRNRVFPASPAMLLAQRMLLGVRGKGGHRLQPGSATVTILEALRDRHQGWPTTRALRLRWEPCGEEVVSIANRWRLQRSLEEFFGKLHGDPDRLRYWRRWMDQIEDVAHFPKAEAFMMRIGQVYIVEFGSIGNAAYLYPEHGWRRVTRTTPQRPGDLKNRDVVLQRINHTKHWQTRADEILHTHTRRHPGTRNTRRDGTRDTPRRHGSRR